MGIYMILYKLTNMDTTQSWGSNDFVQDTYYLIAWHMAGASRILNNTNAIMVLLQNNLILSLSSLTNYKNSSMAKAKATYPSSVDETHEWKFFATPRNHCWPQLEGIVKSALWKPTNSKLAPSAQLNQCNWQQAGFTFIMQLLDFFDKKSHSQNEQLVYRFQTPHWQEQKVGHSKQVDGCWHGIASLIY